MKQSSGRGRRWRRLGFSVVISLWAAAPALGAGRDGARAPSSAAVSAPRVSGVLLPVWADLDGSTPVSGGRISVYAGVAPRVSRVALVPINLGSGSTTAGGVATLDFARLPPRFTVVVSGGRVLGQPLLGSLSVQVQRYTDGSSVGGVSAGPVVHVNPVTTIVDGLERVEPRLSEARAQVMVDRALGIPGWVNAIDLNVDDQWLDGRLLLRDIRGQDTLNQVMADLVQEIRSGARTLAFRAPPAAHAAGIADWWNDADIGKLVKGALTSLGEGVGQAVGVGGASWVLAKFFEAVGLGKFADAIFPLNHIVEQLDAIAAQVAAVKTLVEEGIQATEQSQYDQLVADVAPLDGDLSGLWDRMSYETAMSKTDPTLKNYNADLVATIGKQLVENRNAVQDLNKALAPSTPATYGILQAASAYLGSRKPFFTQASSKAMQAVFDYYQLMQMRVSILLTNYYSTRPDTFSPKTIRDTVIDRITNDIAGQRGLLKPPLPPDTFIDLRTDKNPTPLLWGPVSWVNGGTLEHYCVDGRGIRHRFYANVDHLTCDPPGHDSARLGTELATEDQFKALLDGWEGETPLEWLQQKTGLKMTAAPTGTDSTHIGFYWVGRAGSPANRAGPVEGPFCKIIVCIDDDTLGFYEYLHRYDMQDTSKPSPDAWTTSLWNYDPQNYNANAVPAPKPVKEGEYFWPVGGG